MMAFLYLLQGDASGVAADAWPVAIKEVNPQELIAAYFLGKGHDSNAEKVSSSALPKLIHSITQHAWIAELTAYLPLHGAPGACIGLSCTRAVMHCHGAPFTINS